MWNASKKPVFLPQNDSRRVQPCDTRADCGQTLNFLSPSDFLTLSGWNTKRSGSTGPPWCRKEQILKGFHLSGLHTNYTPERKSKQCFRQVHDVAQKQKTFDSWAGGTKISLGKKGEIKLWWKQCCIWAPTLALLPLPRLPCVVKRSDRSRWGRGCEMKQNNPQTSGRGKGTLLLARRKGDFFPQKEEIWGNFWLAQRTKKWQ